MGGVDVRGVADVRVQPRLLDDLAQQGIARVLAVVEPATGQRPQLGATDARREPAQEHLGTERRVRGDAHDDGVRRNALSSRQGGHAPNLPRPRGVVVA